MIVEHTAKEVQFDSLREGAVFMHNEGDIFMKIETIDNSDEIHQSLLNAVEVETGECFFVRDDAPVMPLKAKLVIGE